MKTTQTLFIVALVLVSTIAVPASRADELDQASKITFSQPVQIPGHVLPAGTYWFVLADLASSRNVVHIQLGPFRHLRHHSHDCVGAPRADREIRDDSLGWRDNAARDHRVLVLSRAYDRSPICVLQVRTTRVSTASTTNDRYRLVSSQSNDQGLAVPITASPHFQARQIWSLKPVILCPRTRNLATVV
jgi:hypothetical protein